MWTHANRVKRTGRVARTRRRSLLKPSWTLLEQSANRLTTVTACPRHLVEQLALRPGRQAAAVPLAQNRKRIVICQRESAHEATADAKRVDVAVLTGDRGWNCSGVVTCSIDGIAGRCC